MKDYDEKYSKLPVPMLLSWMLTLVEKDISTPSVLGLDSGPDILR